MNKKVIRAYREVLQERVTLAAMLFVFTCFAGQTQTSLVCTWTHKTWKVRGGRVCQEGVSEGCVRGTGGCDRRRVCVHTFLSVGMCLEKRAFYRLVSGMHASINTHLSAIYLRCGMCGTARLVKNTVC